MKITQTPAPPVKRLAVGIDLGTTHSLVAYEKEGVMHVLPDETGAVLLPSVVHCKNNNQIEVGEAAKAKVACDPENTYFSVKRLMGRQSVIKERFTPPQLSAEILKELMYRAHQVDSTIQEAVITVPAYFDEIQRQATKEAARLAGIRVLRLLNEPTAAALAYGLDQRAQGYCLVFDLGGGTFDVSLLQLTQGVFQVLATGGDTLLGGDDIDHLIVDWISQHTPLMDIHFSQVLLKARAAKEALSYQEETVLTLGEWTATLTVAQLNTLIAPLIEKTMVICKRVLKDANINKGAIDHIVLVGGSTRIPLIREKVADYFGKAPLTSIDPDQVVAKGAAIQASLLVGGRCSKKVLLLDVIPLSLGVEMIGGVVEKMLPRNTPLPAQARQLFTTFQEGQTGLSLHVVQGERELAKDCRSLARFDLKGIPLLPVGRARIEVVFQVDTDGLLHVEAKELSTGIYSDIMIKPTFGLTHEAITDVIKEAIVHAQEDIAQRKLHEKIIEAEQCLSALEKALHQEGKLLTEAEYQQLVSSLLNLKEALKAKRGSQIKQAMQALEAPAQFFAEKRLNALLERALTGKKWDEIDENNFFTT